MMAMNKVEKAMLEQALTVAALRWTGPVERDVAPPDEVGAYVQGWDCNPYSMTVTMAWSGPTSHGFGEKALVNGPYVSSIQGAMYLFSTREMAIAALRHEVEQMAAAQLRKIDLMLERSN